MYNTRAPFHSVDTRWILITQTFFFFAKREKRNTAAAIIVR